MDVIVNLFANLTNHTLAYAKPEELGAFTLFVSNLVVFDGELCICLVGRSDNSSPHVNFGGTLNYPLSLFVLREGEVAIANSSHQDEDLDFLIDILNQLLGMDGY